MELRDAYERLVESYDSDWLMKARVHGALDAFFGTVQQEDRPVLEQPREEELQLRDLGAQVEISIGIRDRVYVSSQGLLGFLHGAPSGKDGRSYDRVATFYESLSLENQQRFLEQAQGMYEEECIIEEEIGEDGREPEVDGGQHYDSLPEVQLADLVLIDIMGGAEGNGLEYNPVGPRPSPEDE